MDCQRHQDEIHRNRLLWQKKAILRQIYGDFHLRMARHLSHLRQGLTVELGSGMGNIKQVVPDCIRTDLFANPWIDQVENAYRLSFAPSSVANLLLMDVFHHLQFPGDALDEFHRVLMPGGRIIILEPCLSLLGLIVYGGCHPEPLGLMKTIQWHAPTEDHQDSKCYYAAQGNASRIFSRPSFQHLLTKWRPIKSERFAAIAYILSGGYSKPQLLPDRALRFIAATEAILDTMPRLFATRYLVVLQKKAV
ncbi:MAG: methyltransferase domain-containing protein [Desulfobacterales bacterium]|jgi:SAM-dependent methyltransferase